MSPIGAGSGLTGLALPARRAQNHGHGIRQVSGGKMKRIALGAALAATVAACTQDPGFVGVAGVREARAEEVAACIYVTDIRMAPGVYGLLADQGVKHARNRIMADARDAGANTVVFDTVTPGADVYELHAVAYRC